MQPRIWSQHCQVWLGADIGLLLGQAEVDVLHHEQEALRSAWHILEQAPPSSHTDVNQNLCIWASGAVDKQGVCERGCASAPQRL